MLKKKIIFSLVFIGMLSGSICSMNTPPPPPAGKNIIRLTPAEAALEAHAIIDRDAVNEAARAIVERDAAKIAAAKQAKSEREAIETTENAAKAQVASVEEEERAAIAKQAAQAKQEMADRGLVQRDEYTQRLNLNFEEASALSPIINDFVAGRQAERNKNKEQDDNLDDLFDAVSNATSEVSQPDEVDVSPLTSRSSSIVRITDERKRSAEGYEAVDHQVVEAVTEYGMNLASKMLQDGLIDDAQRQAEIESKLRDLPVQPRAYMQGYIQSCSWQLQKIQVQKLCKIVLAVKSILGVVAEQATA